MHQELWHAFDRIKDGLDKQERMRSTPTFNDWCVKALPQFSKYLDLVDTWDDANPGGLLCEWLDWADNRGHAWRGKMKWQIPMAGPLTFYPPTMARVMARAAEEVRRLNLEDALSRLVASLEAPTSATHGGSGGKTGKRSRAKKPTPGTTT